MVTSPDISVISPEAAKGKERLTHERVVESLKNGVSLFETIPEAKRTKAQSIELDTIKTRIADLEAGGDGTETLELADEKGKVIKEQKEGIPVDEMLTYLEAQHKEARKNKDLARAQELQDILRTLTQRKNTKDYFDLPWRWVPRYYQARVREEIYRMRMDGRITPDYNKNVEIAIDTLKKRRELFVPPKDEEPPPPTPPTPPPPTPPTPPSSVERYTIGVANVDDDAKKMAREQAGEYVREQLHVKNRLNPLEWFRAAKFRLGEQYYKYTKAEQCQAAAIESGIYFTEIDSLSGALKEVNDAREKQKLQTTSVAERVAEGKVYKEEESAKYENAEFNNKVSGLITRFTKGEITVDEFNSESQSLIEDLKNNPDVAAYIKDAKFIGNNILEVAQKIRLSFERGTEGLDNLDQRLDFQFARTINAATTEADYSKLEKTMNWLQGGQYRGLLANPFFIGVAFGAAGAGAKGILGWGSKAATGFPLAGAALGGVFAGLRRWTDLKRDFELNERDRAYGKTDKGKADKRRAKLDEFRLNISEDGERVTAKGLSSELDTLTNADLSTELSINKLIEKVAEIDARIDYGILNKVDLIQFSDRFTTEVEKLELVKAQVIAKEKLKGAGLTDEQITGKLIEADERFWNNFADIQQEQTSNFNKYRRAEAAKAVAFGAISGLAGGLISQEVMAVGGRALGINMGETMVESGAKHLGNLFGRPNVAEAAAVQNFIGGAGLNVAHELTPKNPGLSADHIKTVVTSGNTESFSTDKMNLTVIGKTHEVVLTDKSTGVEYHGTVGNDAQIDFDQSKLPGTDFDKLQSDLKAAGFNTSTTEIPGKTETKNPLDAFKDSADKAHRTRFIDNGTPGVYDRDELQLQLNTNPDGTVDIDMSNVIRENTVPTDINHDILTGADGVKTFKNFEILITPNDAADQARDVIKLVVSEDSHGHINLPSGSDLNQFFKVENGKVVQLAKFVEIAHVEHDAAGNLGRSIVATSVGQGVDTITTHSPGYAILHAIPTNIAGPSDPAAGFIPTILAPRKPLGPNKDQGYKPETERHHAQEEADKIQRAGQQAETTNPSSKDTNNDLAEQFYNLLGSNRQEFETLALDNIDKSVASGTISIPAHGDDLTDYDKQQLAAVQKLAKDKRGLEIGEFKPDPNNPEFMIAPIQKPGPTNSNPNQTESIQIDADSAPDQIGNNLSEAELVEQYFEAIGDREEVEQQILDNIDNDLKNGATWINAKSPDNPTLYDKEVMAVYRMLAREKRGLEIGEYAPDPDHHDRMVAPIKTTTENLANTQPIEDNQPIAEETKVEELESSFEDAVTTRVFGLIQDNDQLIPDREAEVTAKTAVSDINVLRTITGDNDITLGSLTDSIRKSGNFKNEEDLANAVAERIYILSQNYYKISDQFYKLFEPEIQRSLRPGEDAHLPVTEQVLNLNLRMPDFTDVDGMNLGKYLQLESHNKLLNQMQIKLVARMLFDAYQHYQQYGTPDRNIQRAIEAKEAGNNSQSTPSAKTPPKQNGTSTQADIKELLSSPEVTEPEAGINGNGNADRYWQGMDERMAGSMKIAMTNNILGANGTLRIPVSINKLTETDLDKIAAYKEIVQEKGRHFSSVTYDPQSGAVTFTVTQA